MTIKPGEDWGEVVVAGDDLVDVASDAELGDHIGRGDPRPVRLRGGDLLTTLGAPAPGALVRRLPIDVLRVSSDGGTFTSVAHIVARRSWWRGPILAVMNGDRLGRWDVAPRAHPNDGRADVVELDPAMSMRARWQARRRLPSGTHVPHPLIRTQRITEREWTFDRTRRLWVDGVARGSVYWLRVVVEPDGAVVHC